MTLSDAQAWTVITVGVLGGVTTMITTILTAVRTSRVESKVEQVHELTNSRLSRIETELAAARAELLGARNMVTHAEEVRASLAREAAHALELQAMVSAPPPLAPPVILQP